jgi:hypothetical protein
MHYGLRQGASKQTICHACQISNLVYYFFKENLLDFSQYKKKIPVNCAEDNVLYLLNCKVVFFSSFSLSKNVHQFRNIVICRVLYSG